MTVGERIKKRRMELGLTQDDLATKMGYSGKSSVCKAETYGDNITTDKISRFAQALDTTPAYLMGWEDSSGVLVDSEVDNFKGFEKRMEAYYGNFTKYRIAKKIKGLSTEQLNIIEAMIDQMILK